MLTIGYKTWYQSDHYQTMIQSLDKKKTQCFIKHNCNRYEYTLQFYTFENTDMKKIFGISNLPLTKKLIEN